MSGSAHAPIAADADASDAPRIAPFWTRLNDFFLFPFQMEPLIWAIALALANSVAVFVPLLGLLTGFATIFYFFKVAALASRGVLHSDQYAPSMMDEDWKWLPVKLYGVLLVYGVIVGLLVAFVFRPSSMMGVLSLMTLIFLLFALLLPAMVMVLIRSSSMASALNPLELLTAITDIGMQYLLLCFFLFLLLTGTWIAQDLLASIVPKMLLYPVVYFVSVCFTWIMAALIGYVMYQHHGALQIDLLRQPSAETEDKKETPAAAQARKEDQEARRRDAELAELVQKGDMQEALAQAREWVRATQTPVADHRRYQRLLLLDDPVSGRLAVHTPEYIALLLAERRNAEALKTLQEVQGKLPGFTLNHAPAVLVLAQYTWSQMDAHATLHLLRGFDKRFAQAQEIPNAYELIVRALKQGMGRGDKALPIVQAMQRRFPDHPSTQEAQWLLRAELPPKSV
ncbi:MAG: hypothetical protein LBI48_04780 [Burkholderiaceae bacterium]|jgi:hypothetical protein|nr:hypothetical protein [Burkholderiaceae bacterium]